ncbi:MAG: phage holin family protein [Gammaproteobacteria bacterium]
MAQGSAREGEAQAAGAAGAGTPGARPRARREPPDPAELPQDPPELDEALRQLLDAGRSGWEATGAVARALRTLVSADFSLARSALGRTLALTGVAIVFGASGWLLLMAAAILFLTRQLGWPWSFALLSCAVLSLVAAAIAVHIGMRYFDHTRMQATRRQLARLGIGELAGFGPRAGSGESSREAARRLEREAAAAKLKDKSGIDVTPP